MDIPRDAPCRPRAPRGPRGLSCVATQSVSVASFREARPIPRVVIVTVADVLKNNGGRPAGPRAAPPRRALFDALSRR